MGSNKTRTAVAERLERALVAERDRNDILRNALREIMYESRDSPLSFQHRTAKRALKEAR